MKVSLILPLTITSLLLSCVSISEDPNLAADEQEIVFLQDIATSKASQLTRTNISKYGVSCAVYDADASYTTAACGSFFFNETISADDGKSGYFWPGKRYRLSFYAYAPCETSGLSILSKDEQGTPTYSVTTPPNVTNQFDFITCNVFDHVGTSTDAVPLVFKHQCTDVRINIYNKNDYPITVKKIFLLGLKYSGTLNGDSWTLQDSLNDFENNPFVFNADRELQNDTEADITGSTEHFIILPQTVVADTDLFVVQTEENGEEKIYTFSLNDNLSLLKGTSYTFRLKLAQPKEMDISLVNISPWNTVNVEEEDLEIVDMGGGKS